MFQRPKNNTQHEEMVSSQTMNKKNHLVYSMVETTKCKTYEWQFQKFHVDTMVAFAYFNKSQTQQTKQWDWDLATKLLVAIFAYVSKKSEARIELISMQRFVKNNKLCRKQSWGWIATNS